MTTPAPCDQGGRYQRDGSSTTSDPVPDGSAPPRHSVPQQLRRRRAASWRCEPLRTGLRDPADPTPTYRVTERELASWRAAYCHLNRLGLVAIIPEKVPAAAGCAS